MKAINRILEKLKILLLLRFLFKILTPHQRWLESLFWLLLL